MTATTTKTNTTDNQPKLGPHHDYSTPSSYLSPQNYFAENSQFDDFGIDKLSECIFTHLIDTDCFASSCNVDNCESAISKSDGKHIYCDEHSPEDSQEITRYWIPVCRKCKNIANAIDFDYCETKEIRESIYNPNNDSLRDFEESFSFKNRNIFLCDECNPHPEWSFSNAKTWSNNIVALISRISKASNIFYMAPKRHSEATGAISLFQFRFDYADILIKDAEHPNAENLGSLINETMKTFVNSYTEFAQSNKGIRSLHIEEVGEVASAPINTELLAKVKDIREIYGNQIAKLTVISNEAHDLEIFYKFFLTKIIPVFQGILVDSQDEQIVLAIISWFCVNYGFLGTYALNRLPETVPEFISKDK